MDRNLGKLLRLDLGVGIIDSDGIQFAFTFDKIPNYRGEKPGRIGFYEGRTVQFTLAQDGQSVKNVVIYQPDNRC